MVLAQQLLSYFQKPNSEIDSNANMSMQHGINITTDFFFFFKSVVSFCLDCQRGLSFSFCLLSWLERLKAHGFSFASSGSSLGLAFELSIPFSDSWICFIFSNVVITIWTNIWTVILSLFGCHKYSQSKRHF